MNKIMPDRDIIFHLRDILSNRAFKHATLPFVVCRKDTRVVDKSPAADLAVANELRKSSYASKSTKMSSVARLNGEAIAPTVYTTKNGNNVFMLDYSISVDGIGCLIMAMPLLGNPYEESYSDHVDWAISHMKNIIQSSLYDLLNDEAIPGTMLETNNALRDARHAMYIYEQLKQYCGSISRAILPTEFPTMLKLFLSEFNNCLKEYKSSITINLPESIRAVNVEINKDGFFSLISELLLTLYIMSDDKKLNADVRIVPEAIELSFSTAFIGKSDAENKKPLLTDYNWLSLDSLSSELVMIGHPLSIDILLASAYLDSDKLTAVFRLNDWTAEFRLTIPTNYMPTDLDITIRSDHSVDSPDKPQYIIGEAGQTDSGADQNA